VLHDRRFGRFSGSKVSRRAACVVVSML
jgi:hypothetical protein